MTLAGKFNSSTVWAVIGPDMLKDPSFQTTYSAGLQTSPEGRAFAPIMQTARCRNRDRLIDRLDVAIRDSMRGCGRSIGRRRADSGCEHKSRSDPLSKGMLLALPGWAEKLVDRNWRFDAGDDGWNARDGDDEREHGDGAGSNQFGRALMPGATVPQGAGGMNRGGRR